MTKGKYIFREFQTQDGERRYEHKGLHVFEKEKTIKQVDKFLDKECSEFWGECSGEERPGQYWFFGEIITSVYTWRFITQEEYDVLKNFMP